MCLKILLFYEYHRLFVSSTSSIIEGFTDCYLFVRGGTLRAPSELFQEPITVHYFQTIMWNMTVIGLSKVTQLVTSRSGNS